MTRMIDIDTDNLAYDELDDPRYFKDEFRTTNGDSLLDDPELVAFEDEDYRGLDF